MMRYVGLSLVVVLFLGCGGSLPDARQAAVHVEVSYDFKAGCIAVLAQDKAAPDKQDKEQKEVLDRAPVEAGSRQRKADFAVFRKEDWGRTLLITVTAHEQSCAGPEVARKVEEFTLDKAGTQTLPVSLTAPDVDDDGYVASTGGGTDCNDGNVAIRPGQSETCDGLDNDCRNGVDDGLTLTDFFLDGDSDGAGAGPVVKACSAPPNHVTSSNDCDDSTNTRTPGKTETCDGVDNNCTGGVDDGLTFTDYFLDGDSDGAGAGPVVRACAQPANHVTTSNDCDDSTNARTPGKAEVCDEVDNNCNTTVDDGLATSAFHPDVDGDGFGTSAGVVQRCRAPTGYVAPTTPFDCDDTSAAVKPGATEVCNNLDDNCVGGTDEGFNKTWYLDGDNDGFGRQNDMQTSCSQPGGYVSGVPGFDCDDTLNTVNPGATEVCNNLDDNCVNGTDENFPDRLMACMNGICSGQRVCNAAGTATECNAPTPVDSFPDADGDGEGQSGGTAQAFCTATPPAGRVTNSTDCDDQDIHNKSTGTEVCDDRDNNCANGKTDESVVCGGKSWKLVGDVALTGRNWSTVAVGPAGEPVWLAGESGVLAVRLPGSTSFINRDTQCGTIQWNTAWVRPSDGQVFLAGQGGSLATYNGVSPTCTPISTTSAAGGTDRPLVGIVGFESGGVTTIYAVNDFGELYSWIPGNNPVLKIKRDPANPYLDLHGNAPGELFAVGNTGADPVIHSYDAVTNGSTLVAQSLSGVPGGNSGHVRGVWALDATRAYAVGQNGLCLKRTGTNTWSFTSPATSMKQDLNAVVAFDDFSVYIASKDGRIRRPTAAGWVEHFNAGGEMRDIAASSRQDIWAVGPSGRVVHFPETP